MEKIICNKKRKADWKSALHHAGKDALDRKEKGRSK
jgi:hypothetical protein